MIDREKVIKGLECCKTYATCNKCPYNGEEQNCNSLRREALTLIKELIEEQEKQKFFVDESGHIIPLPVTEKETVKPKKLKKYLPPMMVHYRYECPECESVMMFEQPYCCGCGRQVKWE